jgi:hypothetical protein
VLEITNRLKLSNEAGVFISTILNEPFIKLLERLNRNLLQICLAGHDVPIPLIDDEDLEF